MARDLAGALAQSLGGRKGAFVSSLVESLGSDDGGKSLPDALKNVLGGGAGGTGKTSGLDKLQTLGDVVGTVDPTPVVDLANAGISAYRAWKEPERRGEHLKNVAISTVSGLVPYLGDTAKLLKYGKGAKGAAKGTKEGTEAVADALSKPQLPEVQIDDVSGTATGEFVNTPEAPSFPERTTIPETAETPDLFQGSRSSEEPERPVAAQREHQGEQSEEFQEFIKDSQSPPVSPPTDAGGGPDIPDIPTGGEGGDRGGSTPPDPGRPNQPVPPVNPDFMIDMIQGLGLGAAAGAGLAAIRPEPYQSRGNRRGLLGTFGTAGQAQMTEEAGEFVGGYAQNFKTLLNPLSTSSDKLKAAFDNLWKTTIELPGAIEDWAEALKEDQQKLTRFHAGVAGTFAQSEIRNVLRSMESGERTVGTTSGLVEALDDLKDLTQPIKDDVTNIMNTVGTVLVRGITHLIQQAIMGVNLLQFLPGAAIAAEAAKKSIEEIEGMIRDEKGGTTLAKSTGAKMMNIMRSEEHLTERPLRAGRRPKK